ncbi:MAG: hypothetical protein K2K81_04065 [Muribaculaceae bacterium]|nr:hypothetical protein [Muribaculaceae bacterium]
MQPGYIYGYFFQGKAKYIGQTQVSNPMMRHYAHKHDASDPKVKEYNYPLSKAFRKYGVDAFEYKILEENIAFSKLDERERYWIAFYDTYYHGYNQTVGGGAKTSGRFEEEDIDKAINLLMTGVSLKEVSEMTGMSLTHVFNINYGYRCTREGINYPIKRGKVCNKIPKETVDVIYDLLQNSELSFSEIGKRVNLGYGFISRISRGIIYRREGMDYPLRIAVKSNRGHVLSEQELVENYYPRSLSNEAYYELKRRIKDGQTDDKLMDICHKYNLNKNHFKYKIIPMIAKQIVQQDE